ncbi:type IV pilus twitching motility protein PilT [Escherichia coli]|nr:type IV pilus twitching motility protein PilT [Escherichia coli]
MNMEEIVALSVKHNVSDLHLCSAWPARWRIRGRMEAAPFDASDVEELLREWLDDDQRTILLENGQLDFAVSLAENQRLRGSAFAQRQGISLALRLLPSHCPQLEQLGAPPVLPELLKSENGLILVTGATGSGKSTTLAAMVGYLNQHADAHILTLEDPVEYLYASQRCLIQQREIGLHCMTFASGLRAALREDPDVILLGELRDSETIRLALTAAETGHLVLATLHTRGAAQAVERLVDSFPAQEKDPVRNQLAGSLRAVLSQKLEVDKQEGRVALFELLINTPAVGNLIREGKTHQLPHVIQTGQQVGMLTFQQSYQQRVGEGRL